MNGSLKEMKELKIIKGVVQQSVHGMNEVKLYLHDKVEPITGSQFLKDKSLFDEFRKNELIGQEQFEVEFKKKIQEALK